MSRWKSVGQVGVSQTKQEYVLQKGGTAREMAQRHGTLRTEKSSMWLSLEGWQVTCGDSDFCFRKVILVSV